MVKLDNANPAESWDGSVAIGKGQVAEVLRRRSIDGPTMKWTGELMPEGST